MPVTLVDSYYYGRLVIAPLNIVLYNIFSDHGPDLYGTSPWTFYFLNGFLNFNVVFLLGLLVFPAVLVTTKFKPMKRHTISVYIALLPFYLWILIFFSQAHKVYSLDSIFMLYFRFNNDLHQQLWLQEERFLYPIYPLIGLSAAITWTCVESCLRALKLPEKFTQYLTFALVVSSSVISISRVVGQYRGIYKIWSIFCIACLMDPTIWMSGTGYHAPMDVFLELNRLSWESEGDKNNYNVCVGKEWHRFPSSFFLPNK